MKRVLFYVQHLLGVGHVYRATRVAHGLRKAGFEVHLAWGGTELPGFDFGGLLLHQLPPVRTNDASFSKLVHPDGIELSESDKAERRNRLLTLFDEIAPDVLITEAYPFGRRQMRFELISLLEKAKASQKPPMIISSIRDIMQEGRKQKRVEESNALMNDYYDLLLVHGDPQFAPIEKTLQGTETFLDKIRYTGLVAPEPFDGPIDDEFRCDVLVTVGGGAFGYELLHNAIQAKQICKSFPNNWLVSTGTELADDLYQKICQDVPAGMRIVRHIPNLLGAMTACKVSVSHSGYNTVADIFRANCASVLYPHTGGKETEQLRRSELLESAGLAKMIAPGNLSPQSLANAIDQAAQADPEKIQLNLEGAGRTAVIILEELSKIDR